MSHKLYYKNTVYERMRSNIKFTNIKKEITPSMAVSRVKTVSIHYSKVDFNRILYSKQQFPLREERNVNVVIPVTDNEVTRTAFVKTRPVSALHEDEAGCYDAAAENFGLEANDLTSVIVNAPATTMQQYDPQAQEVKTDV